MNSPIIDGVGLWLANLFVVSSAWLLLALAAGTIIRQPARRMTVAWTTVLGLTLLAMLEAVPNRPRLIWRTGALPVAARDVAKPPAIPAQVAHLPGALLDQNDSLTMPPVAVSASTPLPAIPRGTARGAPVAGPAGMLAVRGSNAPGAADRDPSWTVCALAVYGAGTLFSFAWLLVGAIQASRVCRRSRRAPESLDRLLRECLPEGIRAPHLRLSGDIAQPAALGVLRPMILLPEHFAAAEPQERVRAALAHELAHLRNGDLALLALCRLLLPFYLGQPLFWLLRRRIRLDQELLADAAAGKLDRTAYAATLLEWARTMTVRSAGLHAAALGLWERPSQLRRRIAFLLEAAHAIEPCSPRRWRLAAWSVGVVLVLGLSLASIRPMAGQPAPVSPGSAPAAASSDSVVFQGRILDPDGKPFAGARLYLDFFVWREYLKQIPPRLRATTGTDGRFHFTVEKSYFARPPVIEPWRWAHVVAMADGFGIGVSDSNEADYDRDLTILLPRDDTTIAGRLLDLQGRPVAGVVVQAVEVSAPASGSLTPFLNAAQHSKVRIYELKNQYASKVVRFFPYWQPIAAVTSGQDGRFVIKGIGRERLVELEIRGPTVRWTNIKVMTRSGPPADIVDLYRKKDPWVERHYGASFDLSLAPSRPYEGVVRDRDSGAPIAGVRIESYKLADSEVYNYTEIKTQSDREGRFRLTGMPVGAGNEIVLNSPEDQPYLLAQYKMPDPGGLAAVHVDMTMKRGVWFKGRVFDKNSGKALEASVRYSAAASNPHLGELHGLADVQFNGNDRGCFSTREDGTYQVPVLPGQGLITVRTGSREEDYMAEENAASKPIEANYKPYPYGLGSAWAEIKVDDSPASQAHDFGLRPVEHRTITGEIFDPEGHPLIGARYSGMYDIQYWYPIERGNRFVVADLTRPRPRTLTRLFQIRDLDALGSFFVPEVTRPVMIIHKDRHLAGHTEVGWHTAGPVQVRLVPWGAVLGRVVDGDGQPRPNFGIQPKILLKDRIRNDRIDHVESRVFTDAQGRLRIEGMIPGLEYRLVFENESGSESAQGVDISALKPGEMRDLGSIRADIPGERN